jgi:shikimate dehydrogenase
MKRLVFGVIGDPVAHSRSPAMHMAAYAAAGLPHVYEPLPVRPEDLPGVVQLVREGKLEGVNVTLPYKRSVLECVDVLDPTAELVGAANTLVRRPDGQVVAHNTDMPALADELRRLAPGIRLADGWMTARTIVLGTGATARSAIVALACELSVAQIVVRGRSFEDSDARDRFHAEVGELLAYAGVTTSIRLEPFRGSPSTERSVLAVVQATSAGMVGADPGELVAGAVEWSALPQSAVALDVVYAPPSTPFVMSASTHHVRVANGLGLLARQGALAFELWLGMPAPFDAMLKALGAPQPLSVPPKSEGI